MSLPDPVIAHLRRTLDEPDLTGTRFELLEEIGRGGMGSVYRVRDTTLDRVAALKVIETPAPPDGSVIAEARLLASLEHPGVVPVYDGGMLPDGRAFCVMRHISGQRLDEYLRSSPALSDRLDVFARLCDVAGYAHSRGVVHRDLKPANIMLGSFGEVFVLDWGIASWITAPDPAAAGTSRYMAPEQAAGLPVDGRADIFALGVLLTEMAGDNGSRPLLAIAAKAQSPTPEDRYATAAELRADVRAFQERLPVRAYREPLWERAIRYAVRNRVLLLLVASYLAVRFLLLFLRPR